MRIITLSLFFLCGCSAGFEPGQYRDFWDQRVQVTAWGIYYISPYGPVGLGYVNWTRNVEPNPAPPPIVTVP